MPDEKPERKVAADNPPEENQPEKKKESVDPKPARSAGARSTEAREGATRPDEKTTGTAKAGDGPKAANGTKPPGRDESEPPTSEKSPATEKPPVIAPPPPTSLYVVEVDNKTGIAIRIEHFDEKTGERKELSDQEYALIYPYGRPGRRHAAGEAKPAVTSNLGTHSATPASSRPGTMPSRLPSAPKGRPTQPMTRAMSSAENTELTEAYYRGVTDYIRALTSFW